MSEWNESGYEIDRRSAFLKFTSIAKTISVGNGPVLVLPSAPNRAGNNDGKIMVQWWNNDGTMME